MARGVNKVILIGNLGRDPELSYTPSGLAVARFTLATTEGRKNQEGEWTDETEWHRIVIFGKTAETAGQYLSKGSQVYIEGKIHYDSYEKDGVKKYSTSIVCKNMQLLGRREDGGESSSRQDYGSSQAPPPPAPPPPAPMDAPEEDIEDDLPF